jgi:ABC-2 type transport system permease protein/sodium transport system permease protein
MGSSGGNGPSYPAPGLGRLARLVRKELSEILRDRRTVITLVLMPLLLYTLLSIAFKQYLLAGQLGRQEEEAVRIGLASDEEWEVLGLQLATGRQILRREAAANGRGQRDTALRPEKAVRAADVRSAVLAGLVDVGVRVTGAAKGDAGGPTAGPLGCQLLYLKGSTRGREAVEQVQRLLAAAQRGYLEELEARLRRALPAAGFHVLRPDPVAVEDPDAARPFSLAPIIPLILILMTITGAVYPAIDLTAGERERGTLEVLVAAPVPRLGLLFAKYVSVLTVAVLTALINLTTMFVTIELSGLGESLFPEGRPTPLLMLELLGLLLLFAAFFSAVLLTITSFARSFKEAQAYLIPLMLASLGPGLLGILPNMELTGLWPAVPLVNIVLLARDLLDGKVPPLAAGGLVVGSTVLYALAAIAAAARIFGSEGVLYNEQGTWSDFWRRPAEPRRAPTLAGALLCLALMFPTFFVLRGLVLLGLGPNPTARHVVLIAGVSAVVFGAFPVIADLWRRVRLGPGLLLRPAPWPALAAGLVLGLSLWPLALEIPALLHRLGWATLEGPATARAADQLRALRLAMPMWLLAGAFAALGVFEELFFRGYLFSALRAAAGPATAVVASAVLFGLMHIVMEVVALERLLTSTALGLVLGWVCLRSGSVLPGMLLHACHNGLLMVLPRYQDALGLSGGDLEHALLPLPWLAAAGVGTAAGLALLAWARPRPPAEAESDAAA